MSRQEFRHFERLRVRWAEVDMQKIVFNGHYLMYVDTAVAGYWRALALPYEQTMAALSGDLFVRKATLEYHAPAAYDDALSVGIRCDRIGSSSMTWATAVFRGEDLLVSGELIYVFADPVARESRPVPEALRAAINGFEAGEPMLAVSVGGWAELGPAAQALRHEVFVQEQHIPADLEWDSADAQALHALAINRLGLPLGTGRLLVGGDGSGRIGRMAVRRASRGSQVGRALLRQLTQAAVELGLRELHLLAQLSAQGFYLKEGYEPEGEVFTEAGIAHQRMRRRLA